MLRLLLIALVIAVTLAVLLGQCPKADGDPGGQVPAPGLCEYPGVGGSGMAGVLVPGYWYWCDFPTEINGSHWHCELLGAAGQAMIGFSMMFQAGLSGPVGGIVGSCTWRCPDLSMAESPNPPGAWRDPIRPTRCKTIGPNPDEVPVAVAEPIPPPAPIPPPILPAVTDPVCSNPLATVDAACGPG
jgi:hypothetical protein